MFSVTIICLNCFVFLALVTMLLKTKEKMKICTQINKREINCVHADCSVKHSGCGVSQVTDKSI